MRSQKNLPLIFRTFEVSLPQALAIREEGRDPRELVGKGSLYEVAISSEEPATQWYWELGLVKETLSHKKGAVLLDRLKKAGPILWNHNRNDQVGRILEPKVDTETKRLVGKIRYSRTLRGQEFELDALDEIRVNVSVGYRVVEMKLERRGDIEKGELDEYLITEWEPHEVSIVSIPADVSVGIDRSQAEELVRRHGGQMFPAEIEDGHAVEEVGTMKTKEQLEAEAAAAAAAASGGGSPPVAVADPPQPVRTALEVGTTKRDKEVGEIIAMAKQNGVEDKAREWIERGLNPEQVAFQIVQTRATNAVAQPPSDRKPFVEDRELENYSIRRAIRMTLPKAHGGLEMDGLEAEAHRQIERNLPPGIHRRDGILIPSNIPGPDMRRVAAVQKDLGRAYPLDSVTATEGTEFKFTKPGPFIDMLRAKLALVRLGARFLPGLNAPLTSPRQTAASTAAWQSAEAATVADSMPAFDTMALVPKTLIDTTGTTKQLLVLASEDMEQIVRDDILNTHRRAIDRAGFGGTGASGQPSGIFVQSGVLSHDVGAGAGADAVPDYTDIVTMIGKVADANADDGALAWFTTPLLAATLKRTLVASAAGSEMIWMGDFQNGRVAGYPGIASNSGEKTYLNGVLGGGVEHTLIFGNFNELWIGEWGAFEIIADPYSSKKSGIIELTSFQMVDVGLRHPASFCKGINAIP